MNGRWIAAGVLMAVLIMPAVAGAHEGHAHKAMGTIEAVQGNRVDVKTTDGKTVTIVLDAKTAITRGKAKVDATALKTGERVSIDYTQAKNVNTAKAVKLGETAARK